MKSVKRDYVEAVYNEQDRLLTTYPQQLVKYLFFGRLGLRRGDKLPNIGC